MLVAAEVMITILLTYLFWYVQAFSNYLLILYGTTIVSVVCITIHLLMKGEIVFDKYPFGIWSQFVLAVYLIFTSVFIAYYKEQAIKATVTYTAYCLVSLVIAYISIEKQSIEWVLNKLIGITILCCYWVTFHGIEKPGYGRILGGNNNPNTLGVIMVLGIFAIAYKAGNDIRRSLIYLLVSLWPLYVIIGCGSRKSLIAASLVYSLWILTYVMMIIRMDNAPRKILILIALCALAVIAISYFIQYYNQSDMAVRMSHFSDEDSNTYRVYLYRRAGELFLDNPVFGVGIDQFLYYSYHNHMAHSTYAEAIADFGFVGSIIYFSPISIATVTLVKTILSPKRNYQQCIIFMFICSELFLGIGQVFFFQAEHFVAWTLIYVFLKISDGSLKENFSLGNPSSSRRFKYVKY